MKKTNKGFSMVELIIVIAIMAILAGALAPALIKYINKSRLSTDIQTGQTIATAIQTALSNEAAFDAANDVASPADADTLLTGQGADFVKEFSSALGQSTVPSIKSKKDMKGTAFTDSKYHFTMDTVGNKVQIWMGDTDNVHQVYPDVGANLK